MVISNRESERGKTKFAALCLLMVFLMQFIFYGTQTATSWILLNFNLDAGFHKPAFGVILFLVLVPGIVVWKIMRRKSRHAALAGLFVASGLGAVCSLLLKV